MEELNISEITEEVSSLDDRLLVLRLSLGKLRAAWEQAFSPVVNAVLPSVNRGIQTLIGWLNDAASVMAALFGQVRRESTKTVRTSGSAIKRTLAGFDQLERMGGGSGGSSTSIRLVTQLRELPEELKPLVEKIRTLLAPLQSIDFSAAAEAFGRLKTAIEPLSRALFSGLEWAWYNLLVPMAQWGAEKLLPAFLDTVTVALQSLNACIAAARPALTWLWEKLLVPMGQWTGDTLLAALNALQQLIANVGGQMEIALQTAGHFTGFLEALGQVLELTGSKLDLFACATAVVDSGLRAVNLLAGSFRGTLALLGGAVANVRMQLDAMLGAFSPSFRGVANAAIASVNVSLASMEAGLNAVANILRSFRVTIPSWVPQIGGRELGLAVNSVSLPRIPYLAQGAVLPANKPFLAMVGDQRHGTNIEAPLSVIQDAVAEVMGANLQTQDAANALLRQILAAIEGISVGDETIGRAARRYEQRLAVMGGVL